ncbi:MAG: hypothetical protein FWG91_07085 [Lachnospiraceae bacterium]|nr:hypothetical protein [Lachnospiraceae bacterium]
MEYCNFCNIPKNKANLPVADTVLFENQNFYVITSIGCLVKDYLMIVSKRHIVSMCYLNKNEKKDFQCLVNKLKKVLFDIHQFYPIIFEHGGVNHDINRSACCIMHAHVHIVPHVLTNEKEMIDKLSLMQISSYADLFADMYEKPYLFFSNNYGDMYLRDVIDIVPSQIIRKWIAHDIGINEKWDWKEYPFDENIISTVEKMKLLLPNYNTRGML